MALWCHQGGCLLFLYHRCAYTYQNKHNSGSSHPSPDHGALVLGCCLLHNVVAEISGHLGLCPSSLPAAQGLTQIFIFQFIHFLSV